VRQCQCVMGAGAIQVHTRGRRGRPAGNIPDYYN
jgi:hypothetical protein